VRERAPPSFPSLRRVEEEPGQRGGRRRNVRDPARTGWVAERQRMGGEAAPTQPVVSKLDDQRTANTGGGGFFFLFFFFAAGRPPFRQFERGSELERRPAPRPRAAARAAWGLVGEDAAVAEITPGTRWPPRSGTAPAPGPLRLRGGEPGPWPDSARARCPRRHGPVAPRMATAPASSGTTNTQD